MSVILVISILNVLWISPIEVQSIPKQKKTWTYEVKTIEAYSDNPEAVAFSDCHVERISRGVYGASWKWLINIDIVEGDENELEVNVYRSESGKGYRRLPFRIERQHLFQFFNTHYKDLFMKAYKDCSDFVVFEDKFQPPLEKKTYTFNKCIVDVDGFPQYAQDGFYKIEVLGFGIANWNMTFTFQDLKDIVVDMGNLTDYTTT
ncbi:uncharacterized protein isoform X2 [Musca autumnalis]|uniref:uncharacterized protein isoform X2 n=1 Tax=Musca autumnalis TaxID=221902 RepID=UPI003CF3054E